MDITTNLEKLDRFLTFEKNWNNYGADKFSESLINEVRDILHNLRVQPFMSPLPYNAVQIEYEKENGDYLEFEISERDRVEGFILYSDKNEMYFFIDKTAEDINREVEKFYGKNI